MTKPWLALSSEPISVPAARQAVRARCHEWGADDAACDAAVLLVSELVTNSVLHARTPLAVLIERRGGHLHVGVRDWSTALPRARHYNVHTATGRGVRLLETMASAWGVQKVFRGARPGKVVWFELPLHTDRGPEDAERAAAFADVLQVDWMSEADAL